MTRRVLTAPPTVRPADRGVTGRPSDRDVPRPADLDAAPQPDRDATARLPDRDGAARPAERDVAEILVVELLGGFGDLLLALPAIHALARTHPGAAVRVLTFAPGSALLDADPLVRETVAYRKEDGPAPAAVARALARWRPDLAVTTTRYEGIPDLLAGSGARVVDDLWRRPPPDERVDRRFLRLLAEDGAVDPNLRDLPLRVALTGRERAAGHDALGDGGAPPVVLVPGAGMPVKRWPADRWRALVARLVADGIPVLQVADGSPPVPGARLLPASPLRALAGLFAAVGARGGVVVGCDTGPTRLGTAVGARAVGLFGPTLAARYGLDPRQATNLQGLPGCTVRRPTAITEQECWWTARCPLAEEPACTDDLAVPVVLDAVRRELAHAATAPVG